MAHNCYTVGRCKKHTYSQLIIQPKVQATNLASKDLQYAMGCWMYKPKYCLHEQNYQTFSEPKLDRSNEE